MVTPPLALRENVDAGVRKLSRDEAAGLRAQRVDARSDVHEDQCAFALRPRREGDRRTEVRGLGARGFRHQYPTQDRCAMPALTRTSLDE